MKARMRSRRLSTWGLGLKSIASSPRRGLRENANASLRSEGERQVLRGAAGGPGDEDDGPVVTRVAGEAVEAERLSAPERLGPGLRVRGELRLHLRLRVEFDPALSPLVLGRRQAELEVGVAVLAADRLDEAVDDLLSRRVVVRLGA